MIDVSEEMGRFTKGQEWAEMYRFSPDAMQAFVALSNDLTAVHLSDEHAKSLGYEGRIVHLLHVAMPYSRILGMQVPGDRKVIHQLQVDAVAPVYEGDMLTYRVEVDRISESVQTVVLKLSATNQEGRQVSRGRATLTFRDRVDGKR